VELAEDAGLVFKSTKPGKFGFGIGTEMVRDRTRKKPPRITAGLVDATPQEYLARLTWQNTLFGDSWLVLGAVKYPAGLAILTTQPFVRGERTEQAIIQEWFEARHWRFLKDKDGAFYHPDHDLLILDALPRNVLTRPDGSIFPFDVVIVQPNDDLKWSLGLA